ncbi:MAG TPA: ankyrin repeat domain-containing protein [Pyrinomonadaceae bacterium]|nr:ankyrin repeat domain-containing protein [Pyrinomonadaceae bacterium]
MFTLGTAAIISRAAAFSGALLLSFVVLNYLPSARVRRQTHFARAAADGNLRQMRLLHMAGVSVNSHGACCSPLFLAAGEGRLDAVRYLLDQGASVNAREYGGRTALTEAAFSGNASVIRELLLRGAEMNAVSDAGTPLDVAMQTNHATAIELLKHYGARRGCELRGDC